MTNFGWEIRATSGIAVVVCAVALLAGCSTDRVVVAVPADPLITVPSAQPAPDPEADSDPFLEARAALQDYVAMSDVIAADGGARPERIAAMVTESWFEHEQSGFAALHSAGLHQEGRSAITRTELTYIASAGDALEVAMYACHSTRDVTVVTATGTVVSPPPAVTLLSVYVIVDSTGARIDALVPAADSQWCQAS
ncbi:hypothetical protein C8A06_1091 [Microbacteriaceae bacterium MWH-Ta3]|nr:hypothetical protein C8A06_1091 [Microbacteriaceae bacterium MWH-Ta3]